MQGLDCLVMLGTPPALQIAAENFRPGRDVDIARSESGELSKDGHRPSTSRIDFYDRGHFENLAISVRK